MQQDTMQIKKTGQISNKLNELQTLLEKLDKAIEELEERLEPMMRPREDSQATNNDLPKEPVGLVPLACEIREKK